MENTEEMKAKKKAAGQLQLVFDQDSMDLSIGQQEEESGYDYPFQAISLSYRKNEEICTAVAFVTEALESQILLEAFCEMEQNAKKIILLNWKNIMHLTTPVEQLSPEKTAPMQQAFDDRDYEKTQLLFTKIFDVSLGGYLLNPMRDSYQVDDIARDYLGKTILSYADCFGKKRIDEIMQEEVWQEFLVKEDKDSEIGKKLIPYVANLSYIPLLAQDAIQKELEETGMYGIFEKIEIPTSYYLYQMEREGVHVDKEELSNISKLLESRVLALETDIYDIAGEEFNINSPKQLGVILFEKMKLPFAKKTKTGYSTSADILEKLRKEDPIIDKILEYRQVSKLKSTYADGLVVFIEPDQRIHGKFNQTITATGRISSTDPNLQNIPIRMELGREIRKVFVPRDGFLFLDADYSQIELRVLAHMSGDERLIEAYKTAQDIHAITASQVFHIPLNEVTPLQRRNAKAVNFGIVYGISAFGLSEDLSISRKEAMEYIERYFETYPQVKSFLDSLVAHAKEQGYVTTMFGRRRPVPELKSSNFMQRSFGERVAMNSPIQGTAADIIKIAMIRVDERLRRENLRSRLILQVHDELLIETAEDEKETVMKILSEEMHHAASLKVELEIDMHGGKNWFEAK